jgi:acyl-CoA synthetase (AMP-forming)/AMP-acid ligase II
VAYRFLKDVDSTDEDTLTYGELARRAQELSGRLRLVCAEGDRVALLFPPGLEFVTALYGALFAGLVCVPLGTPYGARPPGTPPKLRGILASAQPSALLTTSRMLPVITDWAATDPVLRCSRWLAVDEVDTRPAPEWRRPAAGPEAVCLVQYTSGSTAAPNGVRLTHGALLHNLRQIHDCYGVTPHSVGLSWLPHFHDMGLIGAVLAPVHSRVPVTLMSPLSFLRRPAYWLRAISERRATISMAPNFAYELCVRRVTPRQRATLDLSCWRTAGVGAEPVRVETLARFAETFAPCGFRPEAFLPCYGLAEATLLVSGRKPAALATTLRLRTADLERRRVVVATATGPPPPEEARPVAPTRVLVGSGTPGRGVEVVIVDPDTRQPCPADRVGEIWVAGPSVGLGYLGDADRSVETFGGYLAGTGRGPFLRTGDLGFLHRGELFPTGRIKDLIIVDGRNHYPHDIEGTVAAALPEHPPGACAAISVDIRSAERLVVLVEMAGTGRDGRSGTAADGTRVVQSIRAAVARQHDLQVYEVCLVRAGALPRTSSGKLRRHECRQMYLRGTFEPARL